MNHVSERTFSQGHSTLSNIDILRDFILENSEAVTETMAAIGGYEAAESAKELADAVFEAHPDLESILDDLTNMRDRLLQSAPSVRYSHANPRPDLDAAVRWLGARLDDLLFALQ